MTTRAKLGPLVVCPTMRSQPIAAVEVGGAPVLALPFPGARGRALRDGSLLPGTDARLGTRTFDAWLAERLAEADGRMAG